MKKYISMLGGLAAAGLLFSSCSSGGGGSDGGGGGAEGPSATADFTGASITFNPTVTFTADGQITYVNDDESSPFPSAPAAIGGTFTYTPDADFRTGTATFVLGNVTSTGIFSQFVVVNGLVTSFTIRFPDIDNQSYTATVSGSLPAAQVGGGGGGGGGGGSGGAETFTFDGNGNIAPGTNFSKNYLSGNTSGDPSATPLKSYGTNESVPFSIANSGNLEFAGKSSTLSLEFTNASDGIIRWDGQAAGGTVTAVFDTKATSAPSDLTITWTGPFSFNDPLSIPIDGKVFAN